MSFRCWFHIHCDCAGNQDKHCFFSFVSQSSSSGNPSLHCSMSSSADFSDEDDYSGKSGSASPAPGDTLPWNLPRHERSKRKIQGGSVLDPAERAVLRIAGERQSTGKNNARKNMLQHCPYQQGMGWLIVACLFLVSTVLFGILNTL